MRVLAALLVLVVVLVGLVYWRLDSNLEEDDAFDDIVGERPADVVVAGDQRPLDILVIGSDSREGQSDVGGMTAGLSDTTILLHLAADRSRIDAVHVPRDLITARPRCASKTKPGVVLPAETAEIWNSAFAVGGPACTIAQFEQMTGIRVDRFIVVGFVGFQAMVNALGGVQVCVPEAFTSSGVELPAGTYEVTGLQALEYVRNREQVGDGSDIGRIKRQQAFLGSMADKVLSTQTLFNPVRLYRFLSAATSSLTLDPELANLISLAGLASDLRGVKEGGVNLLTMPFIPHPADPNRLAIGPGAEQLWRQLRRDVPLSERFMVDETAATQGGPAHPGTAVRVTGPDYGLCT